MQNLKSFVETLRRENQLIEIETPCDPYLEIAEIHRRVIAAGGPALLFRNPKGSKIPVVTNLFGTQKRVELAFGSHARDFIKTATHLIHELVPPTLGKIWNRRDFFWNALDIGMTRSGSGAITQARQATPKLSELPLLTCWKEDGGGFVTLPLVYTQHPDTHQHNLGMYRIQRHDDKTTGIHWQIGKGGGFHHHVAESRNEALPVNLYVGGPPGLIVSAIAPLPENVPELLLASLLGGRKLGLCDNPAGPLPLVAEAEFAIIGKVPPKIRRPEGPFGDHYGYYSLQHDYPILEVEAVFHQKDPIWPATVVGKPRQEDFFLGDYLQELLSPLFPIVMPAVRDLWSYGESGYHALSAAVVHERYRREAMGSAFRILGEGQLSLTKFLLLIDKPLDLKDFKPVMEHLLARFKPETDLYILSNLSMDTLDYCGPAVNEGSKGVMIGVGDPVRDLPRRFTGELPAGCRAAIPYCGGCLVVEAPAYKDAPDAGEALATRFPGWPLVILVDDAKVATRTDPRFIWTTFTRFEPAADIYGQKRIHRNHLVFSGSILIDARFKPTYPDELFCDPDTAATVSRRWLEYFPKGQEMGDSDVADLG